MNSLPCGSKLSALAVGLIVQSSTPISIPYRDTVRGASFGKDQYYIAQITWAVKDFA